jgi:hypothetical protein
MKRALKLRLATLAVCTAALLAAPLAFAAATPEYGEYVGKTSQVVEGKHGPVKLKVARSGGRLKIEWFFTCAGAPGEYAGKPIFVRSEMHGPIHNGRFGGRGKASFPVKPLGPGYLASGTDVLQAHFASPRRAVGVLRWQIEVTDPEGNPLSGCSVAPIHWSASLKR